MKKLLFLLSIVAIVATSCTKQVEQVEAVEVSAKKPKQNLQAGITPIITSFTQQRFGAVDSLHVYLSYSAMPHSCTILWFDGVGTPRYTSLDLVNYFQQPNYIGSEYHIAFAHGGLVSKYLASASQNGGWEWDVKTVIP